MLFFVTATFSLKPVVELHRLLRFPAKNDSRFTPAHLLVLRKSGSRSRPLEVRSLVLYIYLK